MKTEPYILVIDDEKHICESCDRIFTNVGYKVDTDISATNGYHQALTNPYDALVLDLNLVELDGMQLLSDIRKEKPNLPVVIITGYPSEETRQKSTRLGVTDYITKPFKPSEILESIQKVIPTKEDYMTKPFGPAEMLDVIPQPVVPEKDETIMGMPEAEPHYQYYGTSWFYQQLNGLVWVGAYMPNLGHHTLKSVKLPDVGSIIYRGLPLVEVTLDNNTRQIIPSSITGRVIRINKQISEHPYILERNILLRCWIAVVEPLNLEEDLKASQTRRILVFADKTSEENEYYNSFMLISRLIHKGYTTNITSNVDTVLNILAKGETWVFVVDARNLSRTGPEFVTKINKEFPDVKVIVLNESDIELERLYRKNKIFYYGVNPISNNEMVDILHCAFNDDINKLTVKNTNAVRYFQNMIRKISITSLYGKKVTLLAYNNILKNDEGLGYLLTKDLAKVDLPVKVSYSKAQKSMDDLMEIERIAREKEKNNLIITLRLKEMGKIPGSIVKDIKEYQNNSDPKNVLLNIFIQPSAEKGRESCFDKYTTFALKDIIKRAMISR